ncbi:PREDICTED: coiled-coil domain-containing protein 83 isoform X1 [Calidris pugnax]|uniref:coiled-coil domain-containing protein 83 isoform X1 n=1 Tax=Calidris pugnax TaxID=198806 RepID=UPI00071D83B0|nr:PREDICTED: coiled-coil domain-containing protein 83 isoform X1 [Calidris pugnax]XP_014797031.1 PREDICTED: coiled-coil domain-containing protein 83 isoform X1 [Calidris pugnax]
MEEKKKEEKPEEQLTEPESAFPEPLLEYQIETKEAAIDRLLLGLKEVKKKNKEYHERNDLMKKEQQARLRRTLGQIEEEEEKRDGKEVVTREDVEESLKEVWQYVKDEEHLLKDLHSQIEEADRRLLVKEAERDYWLEYKNVGSEIDAKKIMNLEKDIKQVKDDHHRTAKYYRNALKAAKEEKDRLVERHMKLCKEQALEKAIRYLDKNSCREIKENEWLKEEVKVYQKEVSDLKASIQLLEEENISLVTKLIDSRLQNLRVPRHLFLTQAAGLKDECHKDEMQEAEYREYAATTDGDESVRSATVPCQKRKAFPKAQSKTELEKPQDSDEELWERSLTPTVDGLLYEDEKDFQEYLKLGPLETKLMCVVGRAMPIHKEPKEMPSRSHIEDGICGKSDQHITAKMIKALSEEEVG